MPISPKAALGDKPEQLKNKLDALTLLIDNQLRRHFDGRLSVRVDVDRIDPWIQNEIKRSYSTVGWQVGYFEKSSMRGENDFWFVFTPKEPIEF